MCAGCVGMDKSIWKKTRVESYDCYKNPIGAIRDETMDLISIMTPYLKVNLPSCPIRVETKPNSLPVRDLIF